MSSAYWLAYTLALVTTVILSFLTAAPAGRISARQGRKTPFTGGPFWISQALNILFWYSFYFATENL